MLPAEVALPSLDRRLYQAIHGLPHYPLADRYVAMTSDVGEGLGWVAGGLALAWVGGLKGRRAGLSTVVSSLAASYLVNRALKPVFRRHRPFLASPATAYQPLPTDASFPSGHTASSFAAATALSVFYPKAAPAFFSFASLVGFARVHLGHHFPSDVAAGAGIGIATGFFTAWLLRLPRAL